MELHKHDCAGDPVFTITLVKNGSFDLMQRCVDVGDYLMHLQIRAEYVLEAASGQKRF